MNQIADFKTNLKKKTKVVIFIINLFALFALGLTFIQPFLYRTDFSVLVISDKKDSPDVFGNIKSADNFAFFLTNIVKTSDFFNSVMSSGFNLNKEDFNSDEYKKRAEWNSMVETDVVENNGIINFAVYHKNKASSLEYSKAIINVLVNDSSKFYANSDSVKFRLIDNPLTSYNAVRPNVFLNVFYGLLLGVLFSSLYIFFTIPRKKDIIYEDDANSNDIKTDNVEILKNKNIVNEIKENKIPENSFLNKLNINQEKKIEDKIIVEEEKKVENIKIEDKNEDVFVDESNSIPENSFLNNLNNRVKNIIK